MKREAIRRQRPFSDVPNKVMRLILEEVKSKELSEKRTGHWALNATQEDGSCVGELANYLN